MTSASRRPKVEHASDLSELLRARGSPDANDRLAFTKVKNNSKCRSYRGNLKKKSKDQQEKKYDEENIRKKEKIQNCHVVRIVLRTTTVISLGTA